MRDLIVLFVHLITPIFRLTDFGGVRAVVAESVLTKHQLLILNRPRRRAPNLRVLDRLIGGFCSLWIKPSRFVQVAIAFNPSILLNFHRVLIQRNLRILGVTEIKTVPYVPISHPFIERRIGTIRRECLDHSLFWTAVDLELKLSAFKDDYNRYRVHAALRGQPPINTTGPNCVGLKLYRWQKHCRGLYSSNRGLNKNSPWIGLRA